MAIVIDLLPSYFKIKNRFMSITSDIDDLLKLLNLVTISSSLNDSFKFKLSIDLIDGSNEIMTRTPILFLRIIELIKDTDLTVYYLKKMAIIGSQITGVIIQDTKKLMYVSTEQQIDLFISAKNKQIYLFLNDFDRCKNPIVEYLELVESKNNNSYKYWICNDNKSVVINFDYDYDKSGFYSADGSYCLEYESKLKIKFSNLRPKDIVMESFVDGIKKLKIQQQIESGELKIII